MNNLLWQKEKNMNNLLWQYANKVANDANQLAFLVGKTVAKEGIDPNLDLVPAIPKKDFVVKEKDLKDPNQDRVDIDKLGIPSTLDIVKKETSSEEALADSPKAPWYAGLQDSLKGIHKNPYAQVAAGGGAAALVAALLTRKKKNRVRNAILAALGGSGAVAGGRALRREYVRRRAEKDLGTD